MWPHVSEDMLGAQWRNKRPTMEEFHEWRADLPNVWVEKRTVIEGEPERDPAFGEASRG
jgi:hypothetical protein